METLFPPQKTAAPAVLFQQLLATKQGKQDSAEFIKKAMNLAIQAKLPDEAAMDMTYGAMKPELINHLCIPRHAGSIKIGLIYFIMSHQ